MYIDDARSKGGHERDEVSAVWCVSIPALAPRLHAQVSCIRDCLEGTMNDPDRIVKIKRLPSGYWRICGVGPCNWAQPPTWPCDEASLRLHAFPEASETFIRFALAAAEEEAEHA